ncbi:MULTISPECIES: MFS transporter [Sphingobium]
MAALGLRRDPQRRGRSGTPGSSNRSLPATGPALITDAMTLVFVTRRWDKAGANDRARTTAHRRKQMANASGRTALEEWKYGWPVVIAAAFGCSLAGLHIYSTGVFIEPLQAAFGWTRAEVTSGLSIVAIVGILLSPVIGFMVDRWGSRAVAIPGSLIFCLSMGGLSFAGPSIVSWWILWTVVGVASLALMPTVWTAAVSAKFVVSRGLALALMLCGTGLSSAIYPFLTNVLINALGWRGAYMMLAGISIVIIIPILWIAFVDVRVQAVGETKPAINGWMVQEALRKRQFYQLCITAPLITTIIVGFVVHLVPLLTWSGVDRDLSVKLVGLIGITSVIGRLLMGHFLDRLPGPPLGVISVLLPVIAAILLLSFTASLPIKLLAVVLLGLSVGGEYDAVIYLSTRYFGLRNFGKLFSIIAGLMMAGVGLGPFVAGALYDASNSYRPFLLFVVPAGLLCALMIGTLGRYPDHLSDPK